MSFAHELLYAGFVPLAVATVVALALRRLRWPPALIWAAAPSVGFVAGQLILASRRGITRAVQSLFAPREASEWLPHAVLLALGVTILAAYAPRAGRRLAFGLAGALCIGLPVRLLAGHVAQQWSALEKISHLALLGATLTLVWLLLASARDVHARLRQALLVVAATGAAIVTALSGSFTLGRMCGVVAAALTGTALVAPRGLAGAAGVVTVALGGLIIVGVFYARLHPANAALLLFSIAAAAGRAPQPVTAWPQRLQAALRMALCLVPLAIALATRLT
jgi:hypothetical protein